MSLEDWSGSWNRVNVCDLILWIHTFKFDQTTIDVVGEKHVTQIDMMWTTFEVSNISQINTSVQLESVYEWNWPGPGKGNEPSKYTMFVYY
jgi:hypothetical protein